MRRATAVVFVVVVSALMAVGCADQRDRTKKADVPAKGHEHDHAEEGPHGGALAEWGGGKLHAEFTVDPKKSEATVYILDEQVKKPAAIDAETILLTLKNVSPVAHVTLKAAPQDGDPKGKASRFVGTDPALAKEMEFTGEISGKANGKSYAGPFAEAEHTHEKK